MGAIASQITSFTIVYSTVYSDADERKHQSSASLAFVWGIHRGRVNSPHKWTVTRKMFPFDDVIMICTVLVPYTGMQVNLFIVPDNTDKLTTGTVSLRKTSHVYWVAIDIVNWQRTLQWYHDERNGVSNHQRFQCSLNRLYRRRSKTTSKLCVAGHCEGNPLVTGGFPSQRTINAKNVSIWWRHRGKGNWHYTNHPSLPISLRCTCIINLERIDCQGLV